MRSGKGLVVALAMVAAVLGGVPPAAATQQHGTDTAPRVVGYPRCDVDGRVADYVWWSDSTRMAVTAERFLEHGGRLIPARSADCRLAAECLERKPSLSGKLATHTGTDDVDRLWGTAGPDLIVTAGGADFVDGGSGADLICSGPGADRVDGGPGGDRLFGGNDSDILRGGGGADVVRGGYGTDVLFGGRGADRVGGGSGGDGLYTKEGDDRLRGGAGSDACFGGPGTDEISGCEVSGPGSVEYGTGTIRSFSVVVESPVGIPVEMVAAEVDRILGDERSWIGSGTRGWRRQAQGGQLQMILATPARVDELCAPIPTGGVYSCRNGNIVALNSDRWTGATSWWPASLSVYRTYLVNHEVGHFLGYGHVSCPGAGKLAPVMMQQTKGLQGCTANGWVYP